jgi:hypothetical protein
MAQVKPVNKKKMSGPSLAALIVCVAILLGMVVSLVLSSGITVRAQEGASSENFEVNGSMMSYFTNSYYQNWYSQYYYYILLGYVKFDPSMPFDEQYTDTTKKETYYDFFKKGAIDNVTKILKYCEAAKADSEVDFAKLEKDAQDYAKTTIASLKESARQNSMDFPTFIRQNFSEYVNENDLYKAIVLEYIANDYSNTMYQRIYDAMTDERKEQYFKDNLSSFISAEYLYFSLSETVKAETVDEKKYEGGKESEEYKAAVAAAEEKAKKQNELNKALDREFIEKLATAGSAEEFKRILIERVYSTNFDAAYETAVKSFATTDKPSEEVLNAFKEEVKQAIIDAVMDGKANIYEGNDATAPEGATKWEKAAKDLPKSVITKLNSAITNATKTGSYTLSTEVGKFLFGGVKAQYGIEYAEGETQGANAAVGEYFIDDKTMTEAEQKTGDYELSVYYVTKAAHRDETILRNVGHILFKVEEKHDDTHTHEDTYFKTFDEAKAAAEKILAEINATAKDGKVEREVFETFGEEHTHDSNVFYEHVNKGDMVEEFEKWLFDATVVGSTGLVKTEYGWHIMFYDGEDDYAWRENAHSAATNADITTWYEALTHEVTVNENLFKTILLNR